MANNNIPYNFMPTKAEVEKAKANMKVKNTSYYNFMPTKVEEEAATANNRKHLATHTRVEIRELSETKDSLGSLDV
ncbi:hypothetical protein C1H46_016527 [Malus baccata]|uniref:Uncharacterized protein n=1 Tax=Malus baccata TaxID=106549 RepID=A0A540MGZ2_MALBA|nr:hypothetical protein C1H46_016527 [Malus baccata]